MFTLILTEYVLELVMFGILVVALRNACRTFLKSVGWIGGPCASVGWRIMASVGWVK